MNSIREELVVLDTNAFVFALRSDPDHPACETLLFDRLGEINVYMPLQVFLELQRNLHADEMGVAFLALSRAGTVTWDYAPPPLEAVKQWEARGARKGDAVIAALLEARNIRYLISENRHFLLELGNLPFQVISSNEALRLLS